MISPVSGAHTPTVKFAKAYTVLNVSSDSLYRKDFAKAFNEDIAPTLAQGCDTVQLTQVGTLDQATKAIESRQPPHAIVTDLALSPGGREGETIAEQAKAKNIPVALGTLETDSPNLQNVDLRLVDKNDFPTVIPQLTEWLIKVLNL